MSRRVVLALTAAGFVAATAGSSFAAALPVGVEVHNDQHGTVVQVDTFGQPSVAAGTVDGSVCVGASYQLPKCVTP